LLYKIQKSKIASLVSRLIKLQKLRRGGGAVLFLLLTTIIVYPNLISKNIDVAIGQVAPYTIKAEMDIVFEDKNKTAMERTLASEKVGMVLTVDPMVRSAVLADVDELAAKLAEVQNSTTLNPAGKINELVELLPDLEVADLAFLAQANPEETQQITATIKSLIGENVDYQGGITQERLAEEKDNLTNMLVNMNLAKSYEKLSIIAIDNFVRHNAFIDYETTRLKQEEAMNTIEPVMITMKEGEKIIGEGEIITDEHLAKLQAQGLTGSSPQLVTLLGALCLLGLLMVIVFLYLYQNNRDIFYNTESLYLLGIITLLVIGVTKGIIAIDMSRWPEFGAQIGYMAPIAVAGVLIAVLLDSRLAVLVVVVLSALLGIMMDNQLRFTLVGLVGGFAGIYSVSKLSQRSDLVMAGVYVSIANMAAILAVGLAYSIPYGALVFSCVAFGIANGVLSALLANGALPILESAFRLSSPVRLLEFSHPNNPLLKRLMTEAPGTYNHSVLVGNLAEAAADAVGGDSMLVRVGAYYHDIGKVKRPYFFIENQMISESPHDKIGPSLSTLIITSHVKDGVEMAKQAKLPQRIVDIIEQHHGTSLVSYFYHKALENDRLESVTEEEFRYEGHKPQTREAAIVMLADSVEAALRSLQSRAPARIEGMVRKLIKDKLHDGQFDECDLTFQDMDVIAVSFVRVLTGIYHTRVEYPDLTQELERRKKRDGLRKQHPNRNGHGRGTDPAADHRD